MERLVMVSSQNVNSIYSYFFLLFLFLSGCSFNEEPIVTIEGYQQTYIGMPEGDLIKLFGRPHSISHRDSGIVVYEYVERFQYGQTAQSIVKIQSYYFFIKEGVIVSKQLRLYDRPGYEPINDLESP